MTGRSPLSRTRLPEQRPVAILTRPLRMFVAARSSGGIVLVAATLAALLWANSPWADVYRRLLAARLGWVYNGQEISHTIHFWIDDALMAVFFLLVGLEIKRELLFGELSSARAAALPIAAALGGVLVPACIYSLGNAAGAGARGWGIPMATDIAFVAGAMALMGSRIPSALAVFLTALAIVDDIFAVVVIAVFYTGHIHWGALIAAGFVVAVLFGLNRLGVGHPAAYAAFGILLWFLILQSGIHSTISGVLLAATIPGRRFLNRGEFVRRAKSLLRRYDECSQDRDESEDVVEELEASCRQVQSPLHRFEGALRPWVTLLIMPLFALSNAGMALTVGWRAFLSPVTLGVLLGLFLGKPAGILLFSFVASRLNLASKPASITWGHLHGAAWLAGIGFTMSLFVGHLAFGESPLLDAAKLGILAASILAAATGSLLLAGPRWLRAR